MGEIQVCLSSGKACRIQGKPQECVPTRGSKFFHFHAVFGKIIREMVGLWELAPPQDRQL